MKTIIANKDFKYGEKNFSKGELFDIDEIGCTLNGLGKMIKMGYVTWGECTITKTAKPVAKKETAKTTVKEAPSKSKKSTTSSRTNKTDKSES
jgi:hypothetical protein